MLDKFLSQFSFSQYNSYWLILIFILIIVDFYYLKLSKQQLESFQMIDTGDPSHVRSGTDRGCLYLAGPTKCFSCEKDLIRRYGCEHAYLGQPTKCFSCEQQLHQQKGPDYANLGQPTKCFSCESQIMAEKQDIASEQRQQEEVSKQSSGDKQGFWSFLT